MMRGEQGASEVNSDFFIYLTECGWWGGHRESSFYAHDATKYALRTGIIDLVDYYI